MDEKGLIRIVLADDHDLMREGTRVILEHCKDMHIVAEAKDGEEALDLIGRLKPDVAILDVRMPKLNGIEVVQHVKEVSPLTAVMMLTAYDDDDYILALMEAGVLGYLLKTTRTGELIDAVRRVHLGEPVLSPVIARRVARLWAEQRRTASSRNPDQLTPREMTVLELAARGLRNRVIAENLGVSVRTVEGQLHNVLTKLGVSSRVEAVLYAISHHIVTIEDST